MSHSQSDSVDGVGETRAPGPRPAMTSPHLLLFLVALVAGQRLKLLLFLSVLLSLACRHGWWNELGSREDNQWGGWWMEGGGRAGVDGRWKVEGSSSVSRKQGGSRGKAEDCKQQALPSLSELIATAAPCRLRGRG